MAANRYCLDAPAWAGSAVPCAGVLSRGCSPEQFRHCLESSSKEKEMEVLKDKFP